MTTIIIAAVAMFAALYAIGAMLGLVAAAFSRAGRYHEGGRDGHDENAERKEA